MLAPSPRRPRKRGRFSCSLLLSLTLAVGLLLTRSASAAESVVPDALRGTPFEASANAALVPALTRGAEVRRSSLDGTLNADDRNRLHGLGLQRPDVSVVSLHFIPRTNAERQLGRLRELAQRIEGFAPSGACDRLTGDGIGTGLCAGSVDGPLGKVPVRMPVGIVLRQEPGSLRLSVENTRALEAKTLFSWSSIVDPHHLKVLVDLYPTDAGWFVYTRVGVAMRAHASSARTLSDALLKLDGWLCRELARV
jgi:hypothetical protein